MALTTKSLTVSNDAQINGTLEVTNISTLLSSIITDDATYLPHINFSDSSIYIGAYTAKISFNDNSSNNIKLQAGSSYLNFLPAYFDLNLGGTNDSMDKLILSSANSTLSASAILNICAGSLKLDSNLITLSSSRYSSSSSIKIEPINYKFILSELNGSSTNEYSVSLPKKNCTLVGYGSSDGSTKLVKGDGTWFVPICINGTTMTSLTQSQNDAGIYAPNTLSQFQTRPLGDYYNTVVGRSYCVMDANKVSTLPRWTDPLAEKDYYLISSAVKAGEEYSIAVDLRFCRSATFIVAKTDGGLLCTTLNHAAIMKYDTIYDTTKQQIAICSANSHIWFGITSMSTTSSGAAVSKIYISKTGKTSDVTGNFFCYIDY